MKNPSLSPHSIIQPSVPQNMQELASHLVCTACIIHLAPPLHSPCHLGHLCPCSDHGLRHSCPPHPRLKPMPPQTVWFTLPLAPSTARTCVHTPVHVHTPRAHAPCTVHIHTLAICTCGVHAIHIGQPAHEVGVVEALSKWLAI